MAKERTNQNWRTKKISLLVKDPRYNLRSLATIAEEVLHVHGGHDSSPACFTLLLPGMLREPGLNPAKVLANAQLHGFERDVSSLLDLYHHQPLVVLHREGHPEAVHLRLMTRGRQLLL
jgi:hypothetical protein